MQEILDEIKAIEKVIVDVHKQAAAIVYNRRDIKEPLSFTEAAQYDKLNSRCLELQKELTTLKRKKAVIDDAQARLERIVAVELKEGELQILDVLGKSYPKVIKAGQIGVKTKLKRNRVYEYIRGFQIAGLVVHKSHTATYEGYVLTDKGLEYFHIKNKTQ